MAKSVAQLTTAFDAASAEELEAQKTFEAADNDADKAAAKELLTAAAQKRSDLENELADAKAKASKAKTTPKKTNAASTASEASEEQNAATEPNSKKGKGPAVEVSSAAPRRRAGMKFGPTPVTIHRGDITDKQWEAIDTDPMLKVATAKE